MLEFLRFRGCVDGGTGRWRRCSASLRSGPVLETFFFLRMLVYKKFDPPGPKHEEADRALFQNRRDKKIFFDYKAETGKNFYPSKRENFRSWKANPNPKFL